MTTETITWHDATTTKPDSDMTVLCWNDGGYFCGYWDDGRAEWIDCVSGAVAVVTHWAEPEGPKP